MFADVMKSVKGVSSRRINQLLRRTGHVREEESFDHVMRLKERSRARYEYVCMNPVRAGLCERVEDYQWSSARIWKRHPCENEPLVMDNDLIYWRKSR